ncbi:MAG: hypothetical protein Q8O51_02825, partial [bacterium]|nr:hypothetical protein [bacterium]
ISGRVYSGNAVTCQIFAGSTGTVGHWFDNLQVRVTTNTPVIRQSVDSTSCNGQVGDKLGCHLFNDTANTALTYDVDLSPLGFKPTDADATGGPATCADQPERCDSNIVLKVSRDRTCSQWLAPTTTIESTKPTGQKENLVLGVATCDRFSPSGQCNRFVDEKRCANNPKQTCVDDDDCGGAIGACKPFPLDGNTQAYSREDLRNKSGLVVAGLQFGRSCSQDSSKSCANDADCGAGNTCLLTQLIEGKFPFGIAPQTGNDGVAIPDNILNGNFDATPTIQSSGWELTSASGSDGSNVKIVTSETLQAGNTVAPVEVNPYAELTPSSGGSAFTTLRTSDAALSGRLSSDRTYMLSFSARYVQAPDLAVQDTTLSAGIATQASVSIVANNAWFGKVLPTTTMQRYVIGPLKLSDGICGIGNECATLAQGNIAGINHKSFDPNTGIVYFMLDDGNRTGLIIDDVSLLPTLNVDDPLPATAGLTGQPSGDAYVARTCRAYPNSSALVCSYADDTGKRFDGWQGYCLERDPQNPNSCLSWYPVDLLAGSRNIFGKVEMAGYSDKAPLYMCLRAKGNYNRSVAIGTTNYTTFTTAFVRAEEAVGAAGEQPGSPLLNQSFQYRRPMMTQMGSGANGGPGIGYGVTSLSSGGTALTPVDFVQAAVGQDHDIHKSEIEKIAVLFQYGESNTWIPSANQSCYNDDCPNRGAAYSGLTPDGLAYMILDENANGNCPRLTGDHWCATWRGIEEPDNSGRSNFLTFNVNFDTNGYVLEYGAYAYDSTYGGGFAAAVVYYLREQCTDLVRVVDTSGQNAAWSTNITSSGFALPNYKYKLSQEDKPYGSIAPPAQNFDTPTDWDGITAFTGNQMLEVKQNTATARAGSAYTCTGDCSGRQCFGLPATALGAANASYSCNTVADIQACTSAGGYCNGFGPAKLCVAGPRANPATPVACATNDECGINGRCDYAGRYCSVTTGGIAVGTACTTSTDCGTGGTCSTFTNISGGVYATRKLNNILAIDRLKLLFANVYTAWQWTPANGNGAYAETQSLIDDWQDDYQDMQLCNGTTLDRNAADFDPARAYCANLPSISNVAIGTQTAGDIVVSSGELLQLRFNTFVDSQQLPLKNIAIDWDGDNASDELLSWGFAPLSNPADPHSISHVYRYGYGMSNCFAAGTGPYATNASVGGKEYCVVQPQVQVQDNWEWCNGGRCLTSTPTAFPASSGSYWQQFGGDIIVVRR